MCQQSRKAKTFLKIVMAETYKEYRSKYVLFFKTSSRRACKATYRPPQDVFGRGVFKTSSRRLRRRFANTCCRRLEDVLEDKKNLALKMFSIRLQHVFTKRNVCWGSSRKQVPGVFSTLLHPLFLNFQCPKKDPMLWITLS